MMRPLLYWLSAHLPCRFIDGDQGEPYLERYYLFGISGWHCYLHRFVASDPDRGLHDHPWDRAVSLVLSGGYEEIRLLDRDRGHTEVRRIRPGQLNKLRGEDFHRVVLRDNRPAWTLFLHGPRVKGWGFLHNGTFRVYAADASESRHRDWWRTAPSGRRMRTNRPCAPISQGAPAQGKGMG